MGQRHISRTKSSHPAVIFFSSATAKSPAVMTGPIGGLGKIGITPRVNAAAANKHDEAPRAVNARRAAGKACHVYVIDTSAVKHPDSIENVFVSVGVDDLTGAFEARRRREGVDCLGWTSPAYAPVSSRDGRHCSRAWVSRAFGACNSSNRDEVEKELQSIVRDAVRAGNLEDVDWHNRPLPRQVRPRASTDARPAVSLTPPTFCNRQPIDSRRPNRAGAQSEATAALSACPERCLTALDCVAGTCAVLDWDLHTIVGTCTVLEKEYFRLTSVSRDFADTPRLPPPPACTYCVWWVQAPDPSTVRPLSVLRQTLVLLKDKWKSGEDYSYLCDQFKSMRQDLTVQRIQNEFTVQVYEVHARLALEKVTPKNILPRAIVKRSPPVVLEAPVLRAAKPSNSLRECEMNLIPPLFQGDLGEYNQEDPNVKHALAVRSALANGDYHALFNLYNRAPDMGGYLMDRFIERERVASMVVICTAWVEVRFLRRELGFGSTAECRKFLDAFGTLYITTAAAPSSGGKKSKKAKTAAPPPHVDCKNSLQAWVQARKTFQVIDIQGEGRAPGSPPFGRGEISRVEAEFRATPRPARLRPLPFVAQFVVLSICRDGCKVGHAFFPQKKFPLGQPVSRRPLRLDRGVLIRPLRHSVVYVGPVTRITRKPYEPDPGGSPGIIDVPRRAQRTSRVSLVDPILPTQKKEKEKPYAAHEYPKKITGAGFCRSWTATLHGMPRNMAEVRSVWTSGPSF
ncbi:MAG: hypothetical protein BJ554DRAFT_1238 [Olpidium bornovanus]|uniref:SAC3/GANP/THP3 conserved domain-containing protein n=1 Tax=Olpidium bornovanus TaxID=278681 RepID=A0A8H7ZRX5_9FUNG|nr:MAG: hypothetical protein BJ554DRAFT_1238 [Olpidium bornovanus]